LVKLIVDVCQIISNERKRMWLYTK